MQRIRNIDLVRLLLVMIIVYGHLSAFLTGSLSIYRFKGPWWCGVEILFMLSGFFFAFSGKRLSFVEFVIKKIARLWPVMVFVLLLWGVGNKLEWVASFSAYGDFLNLFFLQASGMTTALYDNGPAWYVSSLFWALLFYFALLQSLSRNKAHLIMGVLVFVCYCALVQTGNGGQVSPLIAGYFVPGMIRALAGVGLGYFLGLFYQFVRDKKLADNLSAAARWGWTLAEGYVLVFLLQNLSLHQINFYNVMIYVITGAILCLSFSLRLGWISRLTDTAFCAAVGKYSYSIYMVSALVLCICQQKLVPHIANMGAWYIVAVMAATVISGILVYHFVEIPCEKYIKKKMDFILTAADKKKVKEEII